MCLRVCTCVCACMCVWFATYSERQKLEAASPESLQPVCSDGAGGREREGGDRHVKERGEQLWAGMAAS